MENSRIEYKRELTDGLEKEVVAFLNAREGGILYIGIDKDGDVFGVKDCDNLQLAIKDRLRNNIKPSIIEGFSDRAEVTSMGGLPYGVTEKDFFGGCSVPRNKEIMRVFRDLEIVEHLGSGVPRILKAYGKEAFEIRDSYVRIVFRYAKPISEVTGQVTGQVVRLLSIMDGDMSRSALQQTLGLRHRDNFVETYVQPALEAELIVMTLPDKPNGRLQKYRLTDKGKALLAAGDGGHE
jgi:predicted HTH transcriptional regulator